MEAPTGAPNTAAGARAMTTGLTSYELMVLVLAVLVTVIGVGLGLYTRTRLQRRRAQLLGELQRRPDLIQDRAFNRIAMARREVELLSRQGTDVGRARDQIAEAQASFDNRRYEQAYQTAQVVHESLVNVRRSGAPLPAAASRPMPSGRGSSSPSPGTGGGAPTPLPPATAAAPPMAKNRAESQFQLRLLDQELTAARSSRPEALATIGAADLATQSHAAFDRSDFTEAFRLALKGRRTLGGTVEALPPTAGGTASAAGSPPGSLNGNGGARADATETAARVAGAERCPECGYPALTADAFCRGCGRPRTPSACPQCGVARTPSDTFCGRCGARFD